MNNTSTATTAIFDHIQITLLTADWFWIQIMWLLHTSIHKYFIQTCPHLYLYNTQIQIYMVRIVISTSTQRKNTQLFYNTNKQYNRKSTWYPYYECSFSLRFTYPRCRFEAFFIAITNEAHTRHKYNFAIKIQIVPINYNFMSSSPFKRPTYSNMVILVSCVLCVIVVWVKNLLNYVSLKYY